MKFITKLFWLAALLCLSLSTPIYYTNYTQPHDIVWPIYDTSKTVGAPWPQPQQLIRNTEYYELDPKNFQILSNKQNCPILQEAIKRYYSLIFLDHCTSQSSFYPKKINRTPNSHIKPVPIAGKISNITIEVNGPCEDWPYYNMDELYILSAGNPLKARDNYIYSKTVWGVLRALETLSQLVFRDSDGKFLIQGSYIMDFPRFAFRGLLLDTSRHFIPVPLLLKNLDAMAYNKLNVFHWHIVDDPSFPYTSIKYPNLTREGAYDAQTHVYSQADVYKVLDYARKRGIRVLSEFDTPGHTLSWGKGQPGLLTPCYSKGKPDGAFGPIDPTKNSTYEFIKGFFSEVTKVFPDAFVHLGGDEVDYTCWKSNPNINKFMQEHGMGSDYSKLEEYYVQRLVNISDSLNKSSIVWQEVFDNGVKIPKDTVVHVWKDPHQSELANVTAAGYDAILSTCWYLNYIEYGRDWFRYYNCEPLDFNGTDAQKSKVKGGAAAMWGEFVDGNNVIGETWPRASAVAERLWSARDVTDTTLAIPRLAEQRCRLMQRGIRVEPVNGPGYCPCDFVI